MVQVRPDSKNQPEKGDSTQTTDPTPCVEPEPNLEVLDGILGTFEVEISTCPSCHGINIPTPGYERMSYACTMCKGKGTLTVARRLPDDTLQT